MIKIDPKWLVLAAGALQLVVGAMAVRTSLAAQKGTNESARAIGEYSRALADSADADSLCFSSDVRSMCCPSACAVRAKRMPSDGDAVLRACWASLGCRGSAPSSVGMFCDCGGKP
jgi:hypothetical protein